MSSNSTGRPNVLLLVNAFWIFGDGMSGGDQMLIQIFRRIRDSFGRMVVLTNQSGSSALRGYFCDAEFVVSPSVFDGMGIYVAYCLRTIRSLRILFRADLDILYSSSDFFPDVLPAFLYKLFHPKARWIQCVFHMYPDWRTRPGSRLRGFIGQYMQRFSLLFIRSADMVVNINSQVSREMERMGFRREKLVVNTPGIDMRSHASEMGAEIRFDAIFLARLAPTKGIGDLPEIWSRVHSSLPLARLGVVGWGEPRIIADLKNRFLEMGLHKSVSLLGYLPDERVRALMRGAKVFVFPSREEGFGIAIADALASGLPVVAWDLPVYSEIYGDHITSVKNFDASAFADAVVDVLRKRDEMEFAYRVRAAKKYIARYSWESIAEKHRAIILGATGPVSKYGV